MSRPGDIDEADPHYVREEPLHESHTISADELRTLYEEREELKRRIGRALEILKQLDDDGVHPDMWVGGVREALNVLSGK